MFLKVFGLMIVKLNPIGHGILQDIILARNSFPMQNHFPVHASNTFYFWLFIRMILIPLRDVCYSSWNLTNGTDYLWRIVRNLSSIFLPLASDLFCSQHVSQVLFLVNNILLWLPSRATLLTEYYRLSIWIVLCTNAIILLYRIGKVIRIEFITCNTW